MPGPFTGLHGSNEITLKAIDGAGTEMILVGVQGDPSFGDRMPEQKDVVDIFCRGEYVDSLPNQQQPEDVGWSVLDSAEARAFCAWVDFSAAVPPVDVSATGGKQVQLVVIRSPIGGGGGTTTYAKARFRWAPQGGIPATIQITATCWGRAET